LAHLWERQSANPNILQNHQKYNVRPTFTQTHSKKRNIPFSICHSIFKIKFYFQYSIPSCSFLPGALAQHNYKKHNGSALIVSYDTKDIEDEYYSWDYENIPKNDTVETTREKWEKRCLVPNQKRHRYLNKGETRHSNECPR
jgi:hypothetical protein